MKKKLYFIITLLMGQQAMAQVPEDALRISWTNPNGTARNMAIGGAMGSLGGELSATFVNPAGIGLYKTREVVLSPGLSMNNNKWAFRGTNNNDKNSQFNFGASGVVFGWSEKNRESKYTSRAVSVAVTRTADFNNNINYKGQNNTSSFAEQYAEELSRNGATVDQALNDVRYAFGSGLAVYSYLVDTLTIGGVKQWIAAPEFSNLLNQEKNVVTTGGITEASLATALNMDDRLYLGASLGIPIMNYNRNTTYRETDASGDNSNSFNSFEYRERLRSSGVGINLKAGLIYKPKDYIRIGLAVHSPTFMTLTDRFSAELTTVLENPLSTITVNSSELNGGNEGNAQYNLTTPWKAIVSGSYVFREQEDIRRQKGFITADIEYVNQRASSFSVETDQGNNKEYYRDVNNALKEEYKGTFNFRVGGELKFKTIMARAGFAYYGDPYKDKELKGSRMFVSGGLGYRDKGMFIDLTYVYGITKDVNFPYRLSDKPNTFATLRNTTGTPMLTVGFKF
jgi:hypothetical protein